MLQRIMTMYLFLGYFFHPISLLHAPNSTFPDSPESILPH